MPTPPLPPDAADDERGGAVLLARAALGAPAPPPEAERQSRERVLAQFRSGALSPRPLHDDSGGDSAGPPAPPGWAERLARALRRIRGR